LIGKFADVTDGPHGYHIVDESSSIVMLTAKNAKEWFTDREGADPIAKSVHDANKRSWLAEGDVILSTRGTVGLCALVTREVLPANIDQDVALIKWTDSRDLRPEFLVAYLHSRFGQDYMARHASGMVQQGLSLERVREIPIPLLPDRIQRKVAAAVEAALDLRREAEEKRQAAGRMLKQALGLEGWQPPESLTYSRRASEVFAVGRLDAQFFAPRYAALRKFLEGRFEIRELGERNVLKGVTVRYYDDGTIPIIRSGDLTDISDSGRFLRTRPSERVFYLERGDVLISSIGFGSIGKVQVFDRAGLFGTVSEVSVLRQNELNPHYLAIFLKSFAGQMQLDRFITGATGQLHLYPRDVARVFVPVIPRDAQKEFQRFAEDCRTARREARALLDRAKQAVEITIERTEEAALQFLSRSNL
jgi:type I restriction enzyme M protein